MVTRQLLNNNESPLQPIAFLDDDLTKKGLELYGIRVHDTTNHLDRVVKQYDIEHIIVAIPSLLKRKKCNLWRNVWQQVLKHKSYL